MVNFHTPDVEVRFVPSTPRILSDILGELLPNSTHESSVLLMDENVVSLTSLADTLLEAAPAYLRQDLFGEFPGMLPGTGQA